MHEELCHPVSALARQGLHQCAGQRHIEDQSPVLWLDTAQDELHRPLAVHAREQAPAGQDHEQHDGPVGGHPREGRVANEGAAYLLVRCIFIHSLALDKEPIHILVCLFSSSNSSYYAFKAASFSLMEARCSLEAANFLDSMISGYALDGLNVICSGNVDEDSDKCGRVMVDGLPGGWSSASEHDVEQGRREWDSFAMPLAQIVQSLKPLIKDHRDHRDKQQDHHHNHDH